MEAVHTLLPLRAQPGGPVSSPGNSSPAIPCYMLHDSRGGEWPEGTPGWSLSDLEMVCTPPLEKAGPAITGTVCKMNHHKISINFQVLCFLVV